MKDRIWVNLDWHPHSKHVKKADLLGALSFKDESFDAIYTSHFIEHIPKEKVDFVLGECFRVLKPGGVLRVVVPDFEEIVREYIRNLDNEQFEKAEFNTVELLDQCVRSRSGGRLAAWRSDPDLSQEFRDYVSIRTGYKFKALSSGISIRKRSHLGIPKITKTRIQWLYCRILTSTMPDWFVLNHINFTNTGELHKWVYDEKTLSNHLMSAGFKNVHRFSPDTSQIENFPFVPLDLDENHSVRKGAESMFIEASK